MDRIAGFAIAGRQRERSCHMTLSDLAKWMRDIDFAMLSTRTEGGAIAGRPMSNNGDVE
jgi:general stress protein 26